MSVCMFVHVFGPCNHIEAKGLEQHRNLLRSPVPKRERGGEKEWDKREREGEREGETGLQGLSNQETWQPLGSQL